MEAPNALMRLGVASKKLRKAIGKDGLPADVDEKEFADAIDKFSAFLDATRKLVKESENGTVSL